VAVLFSKRDLSKILTNIEKKDIWRSISANAWHSFEVATISSNLCYDEKEKKSFSGTQNKAIWSSL